MTDEVKRGRAEWCPVCGKANIAGHKWCHGPVTDTHEKARFEFVDVVPASDFDRVCGERDALAEALRDARDAILSVYTAGFDNLRADACRDGLRAADAALAAWRSVPGSSEPR